MDWENLEYGHEEEKDSGQKRKEGRTEERKDRWTEERKEGEGGKELVEGFLLLKPACVQEDVWAPRRN